MRLCAVVRVVTFVAIFLQAGVLFQRHAQAQCPPEEDPGVRFESTVEYYDANVFGSRTVVATYGPFLNGAIQAPARNVGSLDPRMIATTVSGSPIEGSFHVDLTNAVRLRARRVDGHAFGSGVTVRVKVFIR